MAVIRFMATVLMAALLAINAAAQEKTSPEATSTEAKAGQLNTRSNAQNPLRPADTSSPRATLRGFIDDVNLVVDLGRRGREDSLEGQRAFLRAVSTLDVSTTPDSNAVVILIERAILLKEILDRMELPPDSEIPGADEVARDGLTQWTIPGSNITIQRLESGPRAGAFLFSAYTVQRLHRYYQRVRHLPYKPGATEGLHDGFQNTKTTASYFEREVRNRLKPVDTSSPRSTLEGFLDAINKAYALVMQADAELKASPPTMSAANLQDLRSRANNYMDRAVATIDLSEVPEAVRADVGTESALQLKEIFDRMYLPPVDVVPDNLMAKAERRRLNSDVSKDRPVRWRYPNTQIEIIEIMTGPRQGQFLFSASTVEHLSDLYDKVKDLPYRPDHAALASEFISPDTAKGFYDYYISTPGYLVPGVTLLGRLVENLPGAFKTMYNGQTLWQWLAMFLCILAVALVSFFVFFIFKRFLANVQLPWSRWLKILPPVIIAWILVATVDYINNSLNITGEVLAVLITSSNVIFSVLMAWVAFSLCRATASTIINLPQIPDEGIDASLLRMSSRVIGSLIFIWVLVNGLKNLGVDIVPLLAGLGVGGLAFALAARPTLENVIGSFMIFMDKPFSVGQRVNVLGQNGTVESIGLRSTKIRLLEGPLTSIPNEKMVTAEIINIGRREHIRRHFNVSITYDTPPEKINRAVEILREILSVPDAPEQKGLDTHSLLEESNAERNPHPNEAINVEEYEPQVYFNDMLADSLNIVVFYWYHPAIYWDYLEHAHWINIQIMERFNAEGIDFAFPTQTLHLAGDDNRPLTVGQRWVSEEETFSPSAVLAQAAALGAQSVQAYKMPASDAMRPAGKDPTRPKTLVEGELTDAPIEDEAMHGDSGGER